MAWTDFIIPAVTAAAGYMDYRDRQDRKDEAKEQYEAMVAADKAAFLQAQANRGGGGSRKNTKAMAALLKDYYAQSNAMLQPYADAALAVLPQMQANYETGSRLMSPAINQVLSPEYINSILTYEPPKEMKLPEYLKGGSK
jgi:hypothetical protein